jgi:hypothetical protein
MQNNFLLCTGAWFEISDLMLSDWVSFLAYPNLFGIKGFVVVVVLVLGGIHFGVYCSYVLVHVIEVYLHGQRPEYPLS